MPKLKTKMMTPAPATKLAEGTRMTAASALTAVIATVSAIAEDNRCFIEDPL